MLSVLIKTDSHFQVERKRIRKLIEELLKKEGVKGNVDVSIDIIGDRLMKKLNKKYRGVDETTDVLSFPIANLTTKSQFIDPPDGVLRLGDIVISYPQAVEDAKLLNRLVDVIIDELIIHGLQHLLGQHHE